MTDEKPSNLEWCKAGPDGKGWFWGSHGCMDGAHEGHVHTCSVAVEHDEDGNPTKTEACCQMDDRTGNVRWPNDDGTFGEWKHYGPGWWL